MKNKKGVSMISLVIIIVVTVILVGIATTAGYKYIVEGNKIKEEAVTKLIADAAYRRQNDLSSGVSVAYYEGYLFDIENPTGNKYDKISGLPKEDINPVNQIPDCLEKEGSIWYLFDAESATALGVLETDKFITRNISYPAGLKEKNVKLILADYMTGDGYFIDMPTDAIKDSIKIYGNCLNSPTGNHDFRVIATCTRPATCIYCGEANPEQPALGHAFSEPTCTASGICKRCGAVDPEHGPLGHLMISNRDITDTELIQKMAERNLKMYSDDNTNYAWVTDALKHWHECLRCGIKTEETSHTKGFVEYDADYHYQVCSVCGWESIKTKHEFIYESVSSNQHIKKCTICGYLALSDSGSREHSDTGWVANHPDYHYRICNESSHCHDSEVVLNGVTKQVLFKEAHYDRDNDLYCDVCGRSLDKTPPIDFGSDEAHYGKVVSTDTSHITVEAFTKDEGVGIDYYQFGILNPDTGVITWTDPIYPTSPESAVQYTFSDLKADTEYSIYVKAADKSGNLTNPYKIPGTKTSSFPIFNGLTNIPDDYVAGPIYAGIAPISTELTNLTIEYSLNEGKTWVSIPISEISSAKIELTKETEKVWVKFKDDTQPTPNESGVWEYVIEKIDTTPPTVTITNRAGDDNTAIATQHFAKVTISDSRSGIAPNTEIHYAWSTSKTTPPTTFETYYTKNAGNAASVTFEISTPPEVMGEYYLWILEGVSDRVGNVTTDPVCSGISFMVDDKEVEVTNITMLDLSPVINNEILFVKTAGYVTVSFETDKKLGESPYVTLNGKKVDISSSSDGLSHVGTLQITNDFTEGILELEIQNIVSEYGKVTQDTYTNDDLTQGPVIYDRTTPVFAYISKRP